MRVLVTGLLSLVLLVAGSVLVYDQREISPYVPTIRGILKNSAQEDRNVPTNVRNFIWKVEDTRNIDQVVVRNLLPGRYGSMRSGLWHFRGRAWSLLLPLHFDKPTRIALYCHFLVYEDGHGLSNASNFYFHKQPHELSTEEVAAILAIDRSPFGNSPTRHPDRFEQARARYLTAFETSQ